MKSWAHHRRHAGDERGSVTAEFAVTLPAVILVLACCLSALQIAGQQLRLQDAASAAARSLGRGDPASETVSHLVPGAVLRQHSEGDLVCATASADSSAVVGALFGLTLSARSCALAGGL
ncbi:MAG: TadE family type IV pilus minor pilin [Rhodoglobus sp.]